MAKYTVSKDELLELLAAAVEGIDGYESEMGDVGRYWDAGKISRPRQVVDAARGGPPPWRGREGSASAILTRL